MKQFIYLPQLLTEELQSESYHNISSLSPFFILNITVSAVETWKWTANIDFIQENLLQKE